LRTVVISGPLAGALAHAGCTGLSTQTELAAKEQAMPNEMTETSIETVRTIDLTNVCSGRGASAIEAQQNRALQRNARRHRERAGFPGE
jgi:hypothetical protein